MFGGNFKDASRVQVISNRFKKCFMEFYTCFKDVSRVLRGSFRVLSRKIEEFLRGLGGCFKGISKNLKGCF